MSEILSNIRPSPKVTVLRQTPPKLGGSDSSSREGSPRSKRPKRSFSPTSDDGDLVVAPVGEDIDDTPPPEGQPIVRQAVAFNWGRAAGASVQTYQATVPPKPASCFLPGQAPVPVLVPAPVPAPAPAPAPAPIPAPIPVSIPVPVAAHTQTTQPPPPPPQRSTPAAKTSSRKTSSRKKSEGKPRHFNDQFSTQTGRFKISADPAYDPSAVQRAAALTHGSGPYSSMYRMGPNSGVSPAPPQASSRPANPSFSDGYSSTGLSRSPDHVTVPAQPKVSGSKPSSSKRHSSTKHNAALKQSVQPSQTAGSKSHYYRRDYDKDAGTYSSSSNSLTQSRNPRETASPSLSSTTLHTNPGDNNTSSSRPSVRADQRPTGTTHPLRMVTILMEDIRSGVTDHQLAEVRVPLFEKDDCLWANAEEVCEQLQASASRIYGPARVYTLRGKYRQFFLRVTGDNVDEITPSNLKVSSDRTLDVVVEAPPQQGVLPQPPQIPREVLSPSPESDTSGSPFPINIHSMQGMSSQEALKQLNRLVPMKRRRPDSPPGAPHHQQFAHISPHDSPSRSQTPSSQQHKKSKRAAKSSSYDYSQMSPRSAQYYQSYARNYNIPHPTSPNVPGRMGSTQQEIDAAIVRFIKPLVEDDPQWMDYMESKAKPQRVSEVLKQYHFVQDKVDVLSDTRTPIHWDGAPGLEVRKEHVWQLLNVESPYGPDCQETLNLLALYGPNGHHYEDSRVVDMMNDTSIPTGKPYKRFLKLLRQIDEDWLKDHPDDTESNDSLGSISSRDATGRDRDARDLRDGT